MNKFFSGAFDFLHGVRMPRFAGTWYDSNANQLQEQLSKYLEHAEKEMEARPIEMAFPSNLPVGKNVLALVVPHAGYAFSGQTAAFAYEKVRGCGAKRVFLIGPSHYCAFRGVALPSQATFETPLGELKVDQTVVQELSHFPFFRAIAQVHDQEHSLELQLPLIRQTLGDIPIVPLAVGSMADGRDIYLTGRILRRYLKENDLVIVSSDFTHYGPRFDYQPFSENIPENIKRLDARAFECLERIDLDAFMTFREETRDTICGFFPCAILLSMLPAECHASLLKYRTSQQIVYDPEENSVSYLAIVFSSNKNDWTNVSAGDNLDELTEEDGIVLTRLAREAIYAHLRSEPTVLDKQFTPEQENKFKKAHGVFVTLYKMLPQVKSKGKVESNKIAFHEKQLRGCIGYIYPAKSLLRAVIDNAVSAATSDPRFGPVTEEEMPNISIEVSVLTSPQSIENWRQIRLGIDGIILNKQNQQSVFLPKVAREFGWNLTETLTQLSIKAGLNPDGWMQGAFFEVFQAKAFAEPSENGPA